ncbi:MAB_1171c family putative transporter [Amycolatopsis sp. NPDC059657]|uniref:MAB_1171c family putative transporter n=1 Tax=Amycolatopsis sp. NPDC059657 TaxID=3346899 RepID=UPI00366FFB80
MAAAITSYLLAAALLLTATVRALRLRTATNVPAVRSSVVMLLAMAVTFAVFAPTSQAWANRFVPDLFKLTGNVATLVAMSAGSALVYHTRYPADIAHKKVRPRVLLLMGAIGLMVVMFVVPHPVALTGSFDGLYAIDPTLIVYTITYACYFGGTLVSLGVNFIRFARDSATAMAVALWILTIAAIVGVAHNVATIFIVFRNALSGARSGAGGTTGVCHSAFSDVSCFVAIGTPIVAAAIAVVGFLLSAAAPQFEKYQRWNRHRRVNRRLVPLWELLSSAFPEIVRGRGRRYATISDRVVEIRDGLLLLAPYRDHAVAGIAASAADQAGLSATRHAAIVEAAQIVVAHRRHAVDSTPLNDRPPAPHDEPADFEAEIAWLERVADALTDSVVIAQLNHQSIMEDETS